MKRLFTILLFTIVYTSVNAQFEKVILKYGQGKTRWLIVCTSDTAETCELLTFFPNGKTMGRAKVIYHDTRNRFRPNGDAIIYNANGSIRQNYDHETGTLLTYYPTGELEEKMITPINGEIERVYKYYKDGTVWEEEEARHEPGRQSLTYAHSINRKDFIYDSQGITYNYMKTFHSNGNLKTFTFIDQDSKTFRYVFQFFSPDGMIDTLASNSGMRNYKKIKNGKRYYYHSNGQLREVSEFKNNRVEGEQLRWAANGQLVWKANYINNSRHGLFETWWEDGSPKERSYQQGNYKNGSILRWHRDGRIVEQGTYFGGKAIGVTTIWDTLGGIRAQHFGSIEETYNNSYYNKRYLNDRTIWMKGEGNFVNGLRDGEWKFYFQERGEAREPIDGICAILSYKDGLVHGKIQVFHPNGQILLDANCENGWLEGDYISYRDNGFVINKGQLKKHKKDGIWTSYHYKSNQVYRIVKYENGREIATLKEYDNDGFLKVDWIDNKDLQQYELYNYYKSDDSLYVKHIQPYGWKNMNYYEYRHGTLVKSREISFDNPDIMTQTEYHQNGQRKSLGTYIKNKTQGAYWQWHENGKLKMESHYQNGRREGLTYKWDEEGYMTETSFKNGVQNIPDTREEQLLECSCNKPPKEMNYRFMNAIWSYVDYEKVKARTPYYMIDEKVYRYLYNGSARYSGETLSGEIAVIKDFYVNVNNGLGLNFTPCRRGINRTFLDVFAQYNKGVDKITVQINNFDLSVEFPQNILRLYDVEAQRPLRTSIQKYQKSSVRFAVDQFEYTDNGSLPTITMKEGGTTCYQISEIGTTGFLLNGNNPKMDFSPTSTVELPWSRHQAAIGNNYLSFDENRQELLPNTRYLNDFIGVYFPDGKIYIPYKSGQLTAKASHVLVNGVEIYGNIELPSDVNVTLNDLKDFPDYMETKGFEVLEYSIEDKEVLRVFWKYVGE
ncbi:MAG: toxin-antitoxin system YwqK family antitoxin [Saprospiraceae bacterium]